MASNQNGLVSALSSTTLPHGRDIAIAWDAQMLMSMEMTNEYWDAELLEQLEQLDRQLLSPMTQDDTDKTPTTTNSSSRSGTISFMTLWAVVATLVPLLAQQCERLVNEEINEEATNQDDSITSPQDSLLPMVVAIPEGPLLSLAILSVHVLQQQHQVKRNIVLVPLEPSEPFQRNTAIWKDLQPNPCIVLGVKGPSCTVSTEQSDAADWDRLESLIASSSSSGRNGNSEATHEKQNGDCSTSEKYSSVLLDFMALVQQAARRCCLEKEGDEATSSLLQSLSDNYCRNKPSTTIHQLSHIVYTSGTTGTPKGCMVSHQALQHYCYAKNKCHGISSSSRIWLASALSFDPCLSDILATLMYAQATLVITPKPCDLLMNNDSMILHRLKVTHVLCTPTVWKLIMGGHVPSSFPDLQVVALGGEAIDRQTQQRWARPKPRVLRSSQRKEEDAADPSCRLFATYGVTEACVYQTIGEVFQDGAEDPGRSTNMELTSTSTTATAFGSLVGCAFPGVTIRICQEHQQEEGTASSDLTAKTALIDTLPGTTGEVVLGGTQVDAMSGYLSHPSLTAAKFIQDGDQSFYRTGDRGYLLQDDDDDEIEQLCICGRIGGEEGMVKVNGIRVEVGEIESAVMDDQNDYDDTDDDEEEEHFGVVESCLVQVTSENNQSSPSIYAYVVLDSTCLADLGHTITGVPTEGLLVSRDSLLYMVLNNRCHQHLKAGCRPSDYVVISRIPLSETGKTNRRALPPVSEAILFDSNHHSHSGEILGKHDQQLRDYGKTGAVLSSVVAECLNIQPSQEASLLQTSMRFASLGGDSLSATRITRALYAAHHNVENSRFLGGEYGTIGGHFDVIHLLKAATLGDYVDWLDSIIVEAEKTRVAVATTAPSGLSAAAPPNSDKLVMMSTKEVHLDTRKKELSDALATCSAKSFTGLGIALLKSGVDPNFGQSEGRLGKVAGGSRQLKSTFWSSPLHLACRNGNKALVKALLYYGSKAKSPDASGGYPIHLAASSLGRNNGSGLKHSQQAHRLQCVKSLIHTGVPLQMLDANKQSVLHAAARSGHDAILEYAMTLYDNGAALKQNDIRPPRHFFDWKDRWYRTPVHWAVLNKNVDCLKVLLKYGCDPKPVAPRRISRTSAAVESPLELITRLSKQEPTQERIWNQMRSLLVAKEEAMQKTRNKSAESC